MLRRVGCTMCALRRPLLRNCQQPCHQSSLQSVLLKFSSTTNTTILPDEVKKFGEFAKTWWDPLRPLHRLNYLRVPFARDAILDAEGVSAQVKSSPRPLAGYKIVDVGCAAGIYSEGLAKIGADVTGIDASAELIDAARDHSALDESLSKNLCYVNTTVEELVKERAGHYDALVCSEVVEHVASPSFFVDNCVKLVKPNGSLIFTTINKNWLSGFYVTFWLEYVVSVIPKGTHHYRLLIPPEMLQQILTSYGCTIKTTKGYCLYGDSSWKWTESLRYWYAVHAVKAST